MPLRKNEVYDKKTGRRRRKDPKKVRMGKAASRRRRGKKRTQQTRMKQSRSMKKVYRSGKTKHGRRAKLR